MTLRNIIGKLSRKENHLVTVTIILMCLLVGLTLSLFKRYEISRYVSQAEKYQQSGELFRAFNLYEKGYKISPTNRKVVHGYVGGLIYYERYSEAYTVISDYFNKTNKNIYTNDMDLWVDKAMTELLTKHCSDAKESAGHVLSRTSTMDESNKMAKWIIDTTLDEKDCTNK